MALKELNWRTKPQDVSVRPLNAYVQEMKKNISLDTNWLNNKLNALLIFWKVRRYSCEIAT